MHKTLLPAALAIAIALGAYFIFRPEAGNEAGPASTEASQGTDPAPQSPAQGEPLVAVALPDTLSPDALIGERGFNAICADCHGEYAQGKMGFGPPLVHKIYEPSHHADMAFQMAVQNGVRAHHWEFGDMPPQDGLTQADVAAITVYVRELQRANGIE